MRVYWFRAWWSFYHVPRPCEYDGLSIDGRALILNVLYVFSCLVVRFGKALTSVIRHLAHFLGIFASSLKNDAQCAISMIDLVFYTFFPFYTFHRFSILSTYYVYLMCHFYRLVIHGNLHNFMFVFVSDCTVKYFTWNQREKCRISRSRYTVCWERFK